MVLLQITRSNFYINLRTNFKHDYSPSNKFKHILVYIVESENTQDTGEYPELQGSSMLIAKRDHFA